MEIAQVTEKSFEEMESEIAFHFMSLYKHIFNADNRFIIIPWNEYSNTQPVDFNTNITDRATLELYVDRVFLRTGASSWCRLRVAFDIDENLVLLDEWFQGMECM